MLQEHEEIHPVTRNGTSPAAPHSTTPEERLDSWKEIAAFLGRGLRTVQRWEEVEGLPVHRHVHGRGGTVFAYKSELQDWAARREASPSLVTIPPAPIEASPAHTEPDTVAVVVPNRRMPWLIGAGCIILVLAAVLPRISRSTTPGPPAVLISHVGRISQTVVSPTGDRVVYCWNGDREENNLDLYVRNIETGSTSRLTSHPSNDHSPAWSPDGRSIAFLRNDEGVFVIPSDGGKERLIEKARPGTVYGVAMSWSPDARYLVYSEKDSPTAPAVLYKLMIATGKRIPITHPPQTGPGDMYPSFSPGGASLAFVRYWNPATSDVHVLASRDLGDIASAPQRLTKGEHWIAGVDWLRDGSGLVYSSDRAGPRRLWLRRISGWATPSMSEPVLAAGEDAWQPTVARRGNRIVYSRRYWTSGIWRVQLGNAAGLPLRRLIASTRTDRDPAYSPDGSRIAFVSERSGFAEVWTSDSEGHNHQQITFLKRSKLETPSWSPDARSIAFAIPGEGVYVSGSSGGSVRRIFPGFCSDPTWSHDGQAVYCSVASGESGQIVKLPITGGPSSPGAVGTRPRESSDGKWLYFARGGALWRAATVGASEEQVVQHIGSFALVRDGIYFDEGSGDYKTAVINYRDLRTRETQRVTNLEMRKSGGLAVCPNGRFLLLPLNERQGSELLMMSHSF
jgi:Tol biopolymer transport system component